jgi:hypothetical protein
LLKGALAKVRVNNQGTGTVYVSGATQAVDVNVGGVGNVVLDNANSKQPSLALHLSGIWR